MALKGKQRKFVEEYLKDLNGTQAAIRAGYSPTTARGMARDNLAKPHVAAAIEKACEERRQRTQIDTDYVLMRLVEIDQMDVIDILDETGALKPVHQWPQVWRRMVSGVDVQTQLRHGDDGEAVESVIKRIRWPDKVKNLELLGKHVDVQAWRERKEITGLGGGPIELVTADLSPEEASRRYRTQL